MARGCWGFLGGMQAWLLISSIAGAQTSQRASTTMNLLQAIAMGETNAALQILEANPALASSGFFQQKLPLLEAAAAGNIPVMKRLIEQGADLNAAGDTLGSAGMGVTALHVAVRHNRPHACRWLLAAGANPNLMASGFVTPLHLAFSEGREEMASMLLDFGADPFQEKRYVNDRTTPFELAITRGTGRLVSRMLAFHPRARGDAIRPLEELEPGQSPPDPRAIQLLATSGPALLATAARRGELEAVEALLKAGIKLPDRPVDAYTPLQAVALAVAAADRREGFSSQRWARLRELLEAAGAKCDALAATGFGDLETARRLLREDKRAVNERDFEGATPLHWAVRTARLPFTSFWLEAGASPAATNAAGQTALHLAAAQGLTAHVQHLLAANAPTDTRDKRGYTPLDSAMEAKQTETIRLLLASTKGPPPDRGVAKTIHEAAASGNIVALTVFATPENLEARNELGFTPFHLAMQHGQLGAAAFLLDKGADINATDPDGNTALLQIAGKWGYTIAGRPSAAWLTRHNQDPRKAGYLRFLTEGGDQGWPRYLVQATGFLLANGADAAVTNKAGKSVSQLILGSSTSAFTEERTALLKLLGHADGLLDERDENGETGLHRAAREILGDNAGALIAAGADLNATNYAGRTPLHAAVERLGGWGDGQPFAVILNAKPNVDAQDNEGLTSLHVLVLSDSIFIREAAGALLAAGADPNLRDKQGRTPLLCALDGEWPWRAANPSLGQLIAAGAKADMADEQGDTALHYLARMGEQNPMFFIRDAARHLSSLDVNVANRVGDTPLHVAARSGTADVFDWLRSRGARLDVTNAAGETPQQLGPRNSSPFARFNLGLPTELANAAQRGEVETLQHALKADPSLLNATNRAGETVLGIAARSSQTNLAAALLQEGAQWDAFSATVLGRADVLKDLLARNPATLTNASQGKQLIHLAAESGDVTTLEALLSAGADVKAPARSGLSPLGIALLHKRDAAVAMLQARGASENLFDAVVLGLPERAAGLLELKPSLGQVANQFDFTPVHLAAALERQAILRILLDHDVPADIPAGSTQISPLHVAAACNNTNAIALLVERGARTEVVDDSGCTPLHYGAVRGRTESVAALLALGANPDAPVSNVGLRMPIPSGNTALHFAVLACQTNIVALLLQGGANVNATNAFGVTPLDLTRPGMPISSHWSGPFGSPGIKLAASFRSMGLSQLEGLASVRPSHFGSQSDPTMAAMLQRAGGVYGTASPGWRPR